MTPIELNINIDVKRSEAFWKTLGGCMAVKKMFYLSADNKQTYDIFFPEHLIIISMDGEVVKQETACVNLLQFMNNLKLSVFIYDKINPCGKQTRVEKDIKRPSLKLDQKNGTRLLSGKRRRDNED